MDQNNPKSIMVAQGEGLNWHTGRDWAGRKGRGKFMKRLLDRSQLEGGMVLFIRFHLFNLNLSLLRI